MIGLLVGSLSFGRCQLPAEIPVSRFFHQKLINALLTIYIEVFPWHTNDGTAMVIFYRDCSSILVFP